MSMAYHKDDYIVRLLAVVDVTDVADAEIAFHSCFLFFAFLACQFFFVTIGTDNLLFGQWL